MYNCIYSVSIPYKCYLWFIVSFLVVSTDTWSWTLIKLSIPSAITSEWKMPFIIFLRSSCAVKLKLTWDWVDSLFWSDMLQLQYSLPLDMLEWGNPRCKQVLRGSPWMWVAGAAKKATEGQFLLLYSYICLMIIQYNTLIDYEVLSLCLRWPVWTI